MTGRPCGGPRWLGASSGAGREAGSPCDGPWWLGASSSAGERQAVPVIVPGGWELLLALERGRQSL